MTVDAVSPAPGRAPTVSLRLLQIGALAVVLVATTFHAFELDRFFVPKELVLHLVAALAGLFAFRAISRLSRSRADLVLAAWLVLGLVSAALATNYWLAIRALAISASSALLFWVARTVRGAGFSRELLSAVAVAVVAAAVTSLLQTYGVETLLFSENRAPGGTLGNRNFIAHVAAFGLPVLLFIAFTARRGVAFATGATGAAVAIASLVLTRSRGAWLAFAAVGVVIVVAMIASPPVRRDGRTWWRLIATIVLAALAVAAVLLIPNTLRWRSDSPYLETVQRVADYEEGSGRGRLVQYENSLAMAARNPLFGVGPGNWAVKFPAYATRRDPSLNDSEPGTTFNPWPSSDWIAWCSERGFASVIVLAAFFLVLALGALRQLRRAADVEAGLAALTLLATIAGAIVVGLFDAVLLLAVPSFLVWTTLGALWNPEVPLSSRPRMWTLVIAAAMLISILGFVRSASQVVAMQMYDSGGGRSTLTQAATIDPGSYRLRLRLARMGGREQRCRHALAARAMFPHARAAIEASRGCK